VALSPEGGIRSGAQSLLAGHADLKPGAGAIALLANAAVLPVIIRNDSRSGWRVTIGPPFCPRSDGLQAGPRRASAEETSKTTLLHAVALSENSRGE
jgi:hypothetical protein